MNDINESGFRTPRNTSTQPPDPAQVATAEAFLRTLARAPRVTAASPNSYALKHAAERWGEANGLEPYVSNGALLQAAMNLGIPVQQWRAPVAINGSVGVSLV